MDADIVLDPGLLRIDTVQFDDRAAAVTVATSFVGIRLQATDIQTIAAAIPAAPATAADDAAVGGAADDGSIGDVACSLCTGVAATNDAITASGGAAACAGAGSAGSGRAGRRGGLTGCPPDVGGPDAAGPATDAAATHASRLATGRTADVDRRNGTVRAIARGGR